MFSTFSLSFGKFSYMVDHKSSNVSQRFKERQIKISATKEKGIIKEKYVAEIIDVFHRYLLI